MDEQRQQIVIARTPKSMGVAYALLIFLGIFGVHRFYLDRVGSGAAQAALAITGVLTSWLVIGFIPLFIVGVWAFVDLFLTAGMVHEANRKMGIVESVSTPVQIGAAEAEERP